MRFEERSHYSGYLNREMKYNVYGQRRADSRVPFCPEQSLRVRGFRYDRGLRGLSTKAKRNFHAVQRGRRVLVGRQPIALRDGAMHNRYDQYVIAELIPAVKHSTGYFGPDDDDGLQYGCIPCGKFLARHRIPFNMTVALSGIYDVQFHGRLHGVHRIRKFTDRFSLEYVGSVVFRSLSPSLYRRLHSPRRLGRAE